MAAHPSFKSPTIVEALCEVHFRLSKERPWTATRPGDFYQRISNDYPSMEPVTEQAIQLSVGPDNVARHELLPPRLKLKFTHRDDANPTLLQVSDDTFAINCLRPYPGWARMKASLLGAWPKFRETAQPEAITRIGLRYINRVERQSETETPGHWLKETPLIPAALLKSSDGFAHRLELRLDAHNRLLTTVAHVQGAHTGPHGALVFDLDRIVERDTETDDRALESAVEVLHDDIWRVFSEAKNDNYDQLLSGKSDVGADSR